MLTTKEQIDKSMKMKDALKMAVMMCRWAFPESLQLFKQTDDGWVQMYISRQIALSLRKLMDWVWDEYREKIGIGISGEEEQTEKPGDAISGEVDLRMLCDHFHDDS